MNEHKVSFIICCNSEFYMKECMLYLSELIVPEGFEAEIIEIKGASSMAAGCNEGMRQSHAKYKVYLHQDVFIKNRNFISDMISVFQRDENIGMIGMVGTPYLKGNGTMWSGIRFGGFYRLQELVDRGVNLKFFPLKAGYMEVESVDGLLIATQYDIPWREDLFSKWDFYDVSQSFEFQKAGYKVVVLGQETEWYIHDCGVPNMFNYNAERKIFLKNYSEYMGQRQEMEWEQYKDKVIEKIKTGFHGTEEEKDYLLRFVKEIKNDSEMSN